MKFNTKTNKIILSIILVFYLLILFKLVFAKLPISAGFPIRITASFASVNLIPLKSILFYLGGQPTWQIAMKNLLGNIILFTPLGFLLPLIFVKINKLPQIIIIALIFSFSIETTQIMFGLGSWDIDDIILNTMGAVIGFWIHAKIAQSHSMQTT